MAGNEKSLMRMCQDGEIIMKQGDSCTEMYKILSGKVGVYFNYGEDNEYFLGTLSEQRCFGDVSMLTKKGSPYTVVAKSSVMMMRITSEQFEDFIINNTRNAIDIMLNMSNMIVTLNHNIEVMHDATSALYNELSQEREQPLSAEEINGMIAECRKASVAHNDEEADA